ncbi:ATP-dependent helicase HrpB, partial [Pseudomonas aeruginosa]|nr:ATP-dependent helicase HrpB [Pseudomonas aeruginosa]
GEARPCPSRGAVQPPRQPSRQLRGHLRGAATAAVVAPRHPPREGCQLGLSYPSRLPPQTRAGGRGPPRTHGRALPCRE